MGKQKTGGVCSKTTHKTTGTNNRPIVEVITRTVNENPVVQTVVYACIDALVNEGRDRKEVDDMMRDMFNEIVKAVEYHEK